MVLLSLFMPRYLLTPRQLFQVRFLIGANLLGVLVAIPAIIVSVLQNQKIAVILISAFVVALVAQLGALRFAALKVSWIIFSELGILCTFLTLQSLVTTGFEPIQLQWFLLIPLSALVLMDPQQRSSGAALPVRPVLMASFVGVGLGIGVIVAKNTGLTFGGISEPDTTLDSVVNFLLFMIAMCGLIYLYDRSAREAFAELDALRQLLPLCAWCKEIRGDDGAWVPIDQYVAKHYCDITHSICPGCSRKHFAKFES